MSLYCELKTEMRNKEALLGALADMGFTRDKVEVHATPQTLYGFQGDARPEKAEIILRRQFVGALANDIGFARQKDGSYQAIVSEYDLQTSYGETWLKKLKQNYSVQTTCHWAEKNKFCVKTEELPTGEIKLTLQSY